MEWAGFSISWTADWDAVLHLTNAGESGPGLDYDLENLLRVMSEIPANHARRS